VQRGTGVVLLLLALLLLTAACGGNVAPAPEAATTQPALAGAFRMAPVKTSTPEPAPAGSQTPKPTNTRVIVETPVRNVDPDQLTRSDVKRVGVREAKDMADSGEAVIVDVRSQASYNRSHIAGAISMPSNEIAKRYKELPGDKVLVFY
jgi:hypothetical protein